MQFMCVVTIRKPAPASTPEFAAAVRQKVEQETQAGRLIAHGALAPLNEGGLVRAAKTGLDVIRVGPSEHAHGMDAYAIFELRDKDQALDMARQFMQLHVDHIPGWQGTCEVRAVAAPH
jgi:hypothetical protein